MIGLLYTNYTCIGETGRLLKHRTEEHRKDVKKLKPTSINIIIITIIIIIEKSRQRKATRERFTPSVQRPQPHNTNQKKDEKGKDETVLGKDVFKKKDAKA